jgi:uncharacterized protein (DUF697 family)
LIILYCSTAGGLAREHHSAGLGWLMTLGGIIRIVVPQVASAIGSTIYSGWAAAIVAALIIGTLGAFLSFNGYVRRA